jgi:periplasmic divalent cation tolerance protein
MSDAENIIVFVTTISPEEARKIAGLLLSQKKIACVNILNSAQSMFWWKGRIETTEESLMIIKSKKSQLADIVSITKSVHSYEVPEIIAVPVIGGSPEYFNWLDKELSSD